MKRRPKSPPSEQTISDGQRCLGLVVPAGDGFKAYDSQGRSLGRVGTIVEARNLVLNNSRSAAA